MRCKNLQGSAELAWAKGRGGQDEPFQDKEFSTPIAPHAVIPTTIPCRGSSTTEPFRYEFFGTLKVIRQVQQLWVVAKLLENIYGFQGLRVYTTQQSLDIRRLDEQPVQRELEVGESAEHDVFVLHRYYERTYQRTENVGRRESGNSQYFESKSFVLRIMNLVTSPPSSFNFFSDSALTLSVASASRPRIIAFSKFFLKSPLVPRKLGFAKFSREKYSERSF